MKEKDWLQQHHDAKDIIFNEMMIINDIANKLEYVLPHISEDLALSAYNLKRAHDTLTKSLGAMFDEQRNAHDEFIGSALSACLNK